jgi:MinD-like ATPase involved in chromosome partitioning or flagellar assembly
MALANIATLLACWQKKVLVIDWDLEAPGIEHFFFTREKLDELQHQPGLVELLTQLTNGSDRVAEWESLLIDVPLRRDASLSLITAGARPSGYFHKFRRLDVKSFYEEKQGGYIIEQLRSAWKNQFDFILIDSRTGITDIGGICTIQLPDILALVFTTTYQSLFGAVDVANKAAVERQKLPFDRAQMPVLPLPNKFDTQTEHRISRKWLTIFEDAASPFYDSWLPAGLRRRDFLEVTKIPYTPYFSFGESLPVLEEGTRDPAGLGFAYETVAAVIGNELQNADLLLENRDEFIRLARFGSGIPRIPLRELPARSVLFIEVVKSSVSEIERGKSLSDFQRTAVDAIATNNGTIAMSSGDSILVAFSDVVSALHCALLIQEILAVRKPIFVERAPLRTRTSIHAHSRAAKNILSTHFVLQGATDIANKAKVGQVVISDEARRTIDRGVNNVEFEPLDEAEIPNARGDFVLELIYQVIAITVVTLSKSERDALFRQSPSTKQGGGFQAFLVKLQEHVQPDSNELKLTIGDRERIARYAFDYRGGGWQARLKKIFGRTLGPTLGREL